MQTGYIYKPTASDGSERPAPGKRRAFWLAAIATVVGVPLLALVPYGIDLASADSTALLAVIRYIKDIDSRWLIDTQEFVPYLLYGPWMDVSDNPGPLVIVPVLTTVALATVTSAFVLRRTANPAAAIASALLLVALGTIIDHVRFLPLYPLFTLGGVGALWIWVRFLRSRHTFVAPLVTGILVLVAATAHGQGIYFFVLVLVSVILVRNRVEARRYIQGVAVFLLVMAPWLSLRWAIGPLDDGMFGLSPRPTWVISEGYHQQVVDDFWEQSVEEPAHIFTRLAAPVPRVMGPAFWVVVPLALVGLSRLSWKERAFAVVGFAILLGPMIFLGYRLFPRYFYPALPAGSILAGLGIDRIAGRIGRRREWLRPLWAWGVTAASIILFVLAWWGALERAREQADSAQRDDLVKVASLIERGDVVFGRRSATSPLAVSTHFVYLFPDLVTEDEYVSFLTWNEAEVRDFYDHRNISWVILQKPLYFREIRYNSVWLEPAYGERPVHPRELARDAASCLAFEGDLLKLYDVVDPGEGLRATTPDVRCPMDQVRSATKESTQARS